jgi:hypothetical protein
MGRSRPSGTSKWQNTTVFQLLLFAMTVISAALMAVVSLLTRAARPADTTLARYF